jgi:transcriptional regulator with XRE-family HTH domain
MTEYGFTQEELADQVNAKAEDLFGKPGNCTDVHVRRWLSGRVAWPWPRYLIALQEIFGRTPTEIGFIPRGLESVTALAKMRETVPKLREQPTQQEIDHPVHRREFLGVTAGNVAGFVWPEVPESGRIGMTYVQQARSALDHLHGLDDQFGGVGLADIAERCIRRVKAAMSVCTYGSNVEKALNSLLGEFSASAGWFAFDAEEQDRARRNFEAGLIASRLAGDRLLEGRIWVNMSRQACHIGRGNDAVTMARAGITATRAAGNPILVSLLHTRLAFGYAKQYEPGRSARAIARAETAYDRVTEPVSGWLSFFGPDEILAQAAMCQYSLGRYESAEESGRQALILCGSQYQRNQFASTVHLVECQLAQRHVEEAVSTAGGALALLSSIRSPRWVRALGAVRQHFGVYTYMPIVRDFAERYDSAASRMPGGQKGRYH